MYTVTIEREALLNALKQLGNSVKTGTTCQNNEDCVSIQSNPVQTGLFLYTTDTMQFVQIEVPVVSIVGNTSVTCEVNYKRLRGIVEAIPESITNVTIEIGNYDIKISYGNKPVVLNAATPAMYQFPMLLSTKSSAIIEFDQLNNAVKKASTIIRPSESSPIFNCLRVHTDGGDIQFSAYDRTMNRIMYYPTQSNSGLTNAVGDFFIDVAAFKKIMGAITNHGSDVLLETDGQFISIQSNASSDYSYISRLYNGTFPMNIDQRMASFSPELVPVSKERLLSSLYMAKVINSASVDKAVNLHIYTNGDVTVKANSTFGTLDESFQVSQNPPSSDIEGLFMYESLIGMLETYDNDFIRIGHPKPGSNFIYLAGEEGSQEDSMCYLAASLVTS